ncbi:hypothetical protein [Actinotalea subterranea]|uniref:hypothetical protein n=1 Tax=Actinotalea subterranea TaxID=2607497 RepID=UPI0011ED4FB4|nr:hypothetical protein [Actinotalea subterranea]
MSTTATTRKLPARLLIALLVAGMLSTVPLSASALWAEIYGGVGADYDTSYGKGTGAYAGDTAADNHRADASYNRISVTGPVLTISATGGNGTYAYDERSGKLARVKVCVVNSNPFDSQTCSGWAY